MSTSQGRTVRAFLLIIVSTAFMDSVQAGTVRFVDVSAGGPTHDGTSWCSAYKDLQDALSVAVATDDIRIANGTYYPDQGTGDRETSFQLISGVTIRGGYAGCGATNPDARDIVNFETILSGDLNKNDGPDFTNNSENSYHVVAAINVDSTALLDGVTVTGGNADGPNFGPDPSSKDQGSGINNYWSTARYENCTLRNNYSANHGAFNDHGGATIINCTLKDNESGMWGGGLFIAPNIAATVTDGKFLNNHTGGTAGGGGAVANGGDSVYTNCLFQGNTSDTVGGGMYIHNSSNPILTDCAFIANGATRLGGAMYNQFNTNITITNTSFSQNSSVDGGAIYNDVVKNLTLLNCLFLENLASGKGGGFYSKSQNGGSITKGIFRNNTAHSGGVIYFSQFNRFTIDECEFIGNQAIGPDVGSGFVGGGVIGMLGGTTIIVSRSLFKNNRAITGGGVIYSAFTTSAGTFGGAKYINCRFVNNSASYGGVIANYRDNVMFTNCAFTNNFADGISWRKGGGVLHNYQDAGTSNLVGSTFINCTINNNGSDEAGGAFLLFYGHSIITVKNCIFWDNYHFGNVINEASQIFVNTTPPNLTINHTCLQGWTGFWTGAGNIGDDPLFIDPDGPDNILGTDDDNLQLSFLSPAIDAGDINALPLDIADVDDDNDFAEPVPTDLVGSVRILSNNVDMGAYEQADCNDNGIPDDIDIIEGTSQDCSGNNVPDECEPDCNSNTVADSCDIAGTTSTDCNTNDIPDECDVASNPELDCNSNNILDLCDIADGTSNDCNSNDRPDLCDLSDTPTLDCDGNQVPDICDIAAGTNQDANGNNIPDICELDCNNNGIPDGFDIVEGTSADCNQNIIPDDCEFVNLFSADCNLNGILDDCDIMEGTSADVDDNCIPDECNQTPAPLEEDFPVRKNRFIALTPVNAGCGTAIRVTLRSLYHPGPSQEGLPDFSAFEGEVRWVGPPTEYLEGAGGSPVFTASTLQCDPYFGDWNRVSVLNIFGREIIPSSIYDVQVVGDDCLDLNDPNCYSAPLDIKTGRWGDVTFPLYVEGGASQPDLADVLALVDKWLGTLNPLKVQAKLQPSLPNPSIAVSISDILSAVDAWLGTAYPFDGPTSCP